MKPGRKRLRRFLSLAAVVVVLFFIHEVLAMIAVVGIAYVLFRRRITPEHKRLLLALAVTGFMLSLSGFGPGTIVLLLGLTYLLLRFTTEPLSRFIARRGYSIRWKFETGIAAVAGMFLIVSLISLGAMNFMHTELHDIQDLGADQPLDVLRAVDELEDTRHTLLSTMTPILSVLGMLMAAVLGTALARSVIVPVGRMGQAMRRIATGDFSQPLQVENRDELGELADRINSTARELTKLQEVSLAEERARALRERNTHVTLAQEEERRRISRELHDGLGPSLAAIGNQLRACQNHVRTDPQRAERELEEVTSNLKGHVREIRELIYDLRPLALDQLGLVGAIEQYVGQFGKESDIRASFTTAGTVALSPFAEITVFRVVQECLTNVQKHANASDVEVRFQVIDRGVEARVKDNGQGFNVRNVASQAAGKAMGLLSMRERAKLLGGNLSIHSSPEKGCEIILLIPTTEVEVGAHSSSPS